MLPQPPPPNSGPAAQTRPTTSEPPKDHPSCLRTDRECRRSVATSPIQPTGRDRSTRNPAIRRTSAAARRRWDGSGGAGSAASWARICSARSLGAACMAPWPDPGGAGVPAMPATEDDEQRWAPYYRPPTPTPTRSARSSVVSLHSSDSPAVYSWARAAKEQRFISPRGGWLAGWWCLSPRGAAARPKVVSRVRIRSVDRTTGRRARGRDGACPVLIGRPHTP
jgi:hypothetical protein